MLASTLALFVLNSSSAQAAEPVAPKLKRPVLAAGLNWFLPGAGYAYNNQKPLYVTVPMMAGAAGLTYVENFHQFDNGTLREQDPMAFGVLFADPTESYDSAVHAQEAAVKANADTPDLNALLRRGHTWNV